MTDLNDLDDIFGDDFDDEIDLEQASITVDDFEEDIFIEDDEGGINRSFLFAGLSLLGTFAAILLGIVVLPSGDNESALQTADAIRTFNAQQFTQAAETNEAFETQVAIDTSDTATAIAGITLDAENAATATQDAINTDVAATSTQISVFATQTELANQTAIAAELTANAPTAIPTVSIRFEIRDESGNPLPAGAEIRVYRDDGDREFNPPPTAIPTATPSLTLAPVETESPEEEVTSAPATDPAVAATSAAQTLEADISEFDRIATARAQQEAEEENEPTPAPTTEEAEPTPVAEDSTADTPDLNNLVVAGSAGIFSLRLPSDWVVDDQTDTDGPFIFGASEDALASVTDDPEAIIQVAGPAGTFTVFESSSGAPTATDLDLLQNILQDTIIERGGNITEAVSNVNFPNSNDARVGRFTIDEYDGYIVVLLFDDVYMAGLFTATTAEFEDYADTFLAISQTVQRPAESDIGGLPSSFFMKVDGNSASDGIFQDGGTPPPPPSGGDEEGVPIIIEPDGSGTINLPGEPGTYFLVLDFPPGVYILFIEGQEIEFEVILGQFTETVVVLEEGSRTLIIRAFGVEENVPTITPTIPTATPTVPLQDTPISAFLQTATAAARTIVPVITQTVVVTITPAPGSATPTAIPQTGFSIGDTATPDGLTMLALMGVGLLGVVFIVRRIRSNL